MRKITEKQVNEFRTHLLQEEKSKATLDKYVRDVRKFVQWLQDKSINKSIVLEYKQMLIEEGYAPKSVNSILYIEKDNRYVKLHTADRRRTYSFVSKLDDILTVLPCLVSNWQYLRNDRQNQGISLFTHRIFCM